MNGAQPLVLVVDDERNLVRSLLFALEGAGIKGRGAHDGKSALALAAELRPDAILLDLRLPDVSGLDLLPRLHEAAPGVPVIMISAHGDTRAAVQCVKAGALDYLTKPFDLDELIHLIHGAIERRRLHDEVAYRRARETGGAPLLGRHPSMQQLRAQIARIAASGARTVLLLGPSGAGKGVVARALHAGSDRADGPFVQVNCASLPETLLEAELFGAERGAYTGAAQRRAGLVAVAHRGTLFLDEVGELAPAVQAKLLGFLENRTYRALGAARELTADVRVIAATNRDLAQAVADGRLRTDLYYRLNVISLQMPALAERGDDVLLLAEHFAAQFAAQEGCAPVRFDAEARARLLAHTWPGNVRELRNLVERLTILYPGQSIGTRHLPPEFHAGAAVDTDALSQRLQATERALLQQALARARGRKAAAAAALGISRHALKRRLKRLNLN